VDVIHDFRKKRCPNVRCYYSDNLFYVLGDFFEIVLVSKSAPRERTAVERKMLLTQPNPGGECRKRHSLLLLVKLFIATCFTDYFIFIVFLAKPVFADNIFLYCFFNFSGTLNLAFLSIPLNAFLPIDFIVVDLITNFLMALIL